MSEQAALPEKVSLGLRQFLQPILLAVMAVPLAAIGIVLLPDLAGLLLMGASGSILVVAVTTTMADWLRSRKSEATFRSSASMMESDPAPCLLTDHHGVVIWQNHAATDRLGSHVGKAISSALSGVLVNSAAVVFRQETAVQKSGHGSEAVFTRNGHMRLSSHRVGVGICWRVDEAAASIPEPGGETAMPRLIADASGDIQFMNGAMTQLLGRSGTNLAEMLGDQPVVSGSKMQITGAEGPVIATVVEVPSKDGAREIYAIPASSAGADSDFATGLFDAMPVATLLVCSNGDVQAHNAAARALLGIEPHEQSLKIGELVEGPGRLAREWMKDILDDRAPNRSEIVRMLRGPEEGTVRISVSPLPGSVEPRLLAVLQDATEVQTLHAQFAQSQKMQAIGELAGGVAHDFNNLLTAITGHCDLLLLRHDQGDQDYADLVQIHQNANRAASLVGQLLAFSRKQTMKPELLDLRDTMADLTHLLNRLVGERVSLELRQDPALQPIWADRRLLDQVLMNLVVNARDAMPEGGPIQITSRMVRLDDTMQRNSASVPPGTYVVIEVTDAGFGIPEERISRIFEPFYTTKKVGEGTGLGLSMAYGIMKQSGGYIFCDSVEDEGTTFSLLFPAHDWPVEAAPLPGEEPAPTDGHAARRDSGVILLVEDEAPVRAFASRALRLKGYSVLEAENGDEALEVLEDDELEIDVFVTDMIMPGKGGPDWVREALRSRPDVGVVFTSGYAEDAYGKFPDIPQAVFLAKPFSLADLTDTVAQEME